MDEASNIQHTYIGDGIYAEFDGYSLRLFTQSGSNIFLEPQEWNKLSDWMKDKSQRVKGI